MERLRIPLMGIILVLIALSVPEVQPVAQKAMYSPEAQQVITTVHNASEYYVDKSGAVLTYMLAHIQPTRQIRINNVPVQIDTRSSFRLDHGQSLSPEQCESILQAYKSPAEGTCTTMITYATQKHIDAAYVLYMFIHESSAGTDPNWINTHNTGNIICTGDTACIGRFRNYKTWDDGWKDHIDLLAYYRDTLGDTTLEQAINRWAPPIENDTNAYYQEGVQQITGWREINTQSTLSVQSTGKLHPVTASMQVLADFYAMAPVWCFQDARCPKGPNGEPLGDGQHFGVDMAIADNEKVYAPTDGTFIMCGAYDDAARIGEYVMYLTDDGFEFYSGHLKNTFLFCQHKAGDHINAGDILGYGNKDVVGPHTHIQLRKNGQLLDFMEYYKERSKK